MIIVLLSICPIYSKIIIYVPAGKLFKLSVECISVFGKLCKTTPVWEAIEIFTIIGDINWKAPPLSIYVLFGSSGLLPIVGIVNQGASLFTLIVKTPSVTGFGDNIKLSTTFHSTLPFALKVLYSLKLWN